MPQPTVKSVQETVDSLRTAFDDHVVEDHVVYERTEQIHLLLEEHSASIQAMEQHLKSMEERIQSSEGKTANNTVILRRVESKVDVLAQLSGKVDDLKGLHDAYAGFLQAREAFFILAKKLLKIAGSIAIGAGGIVFAYWLLQILHIHP